MTPRTPPGRVVFRRQMLPTAVCYSIDWTRLVEFDEDSIETIAKPRQYFTAAPMLAPCSIQTRGVALMAAMLVFLGSLQQGQAFCRFFGCNGGCDSVAHSSLGDDVTSSCCHTAETCCEDTSLVRSQESPELPCSHEQSPDGPCDETCWCFAAQQPYQHTAKCQVDLNLVVAWTPPPTPIVVVTMIGLEAANSLPPAPPLTSLGRCVLLSRFLA